jgi:hypothetical protein
MLLFSVCVIYVKLVEENVLGIVKSSVYRLFTLTCILVLLFGCTTRNMNNALNDYMDTKGRDFLAQRNGGVCCVVVAASDLYWKHTDRTVLDVYGNRSVILGENYWKRPQRYFFACANGFEATETATQAKLGEDAYALWCKQNGTAKDKGYDYVSRANNKIARKKAGEAALAAEQIKAREAEKIRLAQQQRETTCKSFGFVSKTESFSKCMFEIYKLEQQTRMNAQAIKQASASQSAIVAAQQQLLEQQRFEQGMQQLQNAANILNPPKTTCKWNALTHTMVCQ